VVDNLPVSECASGSRVGGQSGGGNGGVQGKVGGLIGKPATPPSALNLTSDLLEEFLQASTMQLARGAQSFGDYLGSICSVNSNNPFGFVFDGFSYHLRFKWRSQRNALRPALAPQRFLLAVC
jgi:hypothetical protein